MNTVKNDKGQWVTAIGAPGSIERVKVEYPALIDDLNRIYIEGGYGNGIDRAIELIRERGVTSYLEANSLLSASLYSTDKGTGSVFDMVQQIK